MQKNSNPLRKEICGVELHLPLLNGSLAPYIFFDNAASTPALQRVVDLLNRFAPFYSSIHRGQGFKSRLATHFYEEARRLAGEFVGYDQDRQVVIFGKNTTEAINKLSYRLEIPKQAVIIVSGMEHHSNDLPWRNRARVLFAPVDPQSGVLKLEALRDLIRENRRRLFLVAVTAAANITGIVNPVAEIAGMVHRAGAYLMVDAAQLVPHRRMVMGKTGDDNAVDFLSYSAHKMYAPFGTGVLIARRDLLKADQGPEYRGGGTIKVVTEAQVIWADEPEIDEAGSPNVMGAVALAEAIRFYNEIGYQRLEEQESRLLRRLLAGLNRLPDVEILGPRDFSGRVDRLAVVPFNLRGRPHALVAAILAHEFGIGVRSGCFCAHPYIKKLLGVVGDKERDLIDQIVSGDRHHVPGAVRASPGFYNEAWEIDFFLEALAKITRDDFYGHYQLDRRSGEYFPAGWQDRFDSFPNSNPKNIRSKRTRPSVLRKRGR